MPDTNRYSVCVDFDGVIHSYASPWIREDKIPDPPVPGAIAWLNEMAKTFDVVIHTTRGKSVEGRLAVAEYLSKHGFTQQREITAEKRPALVYIDDRGYRFTGANFPTAREIHALRPWNK